MYFRGLALFLLTFYCCLQQAAAARKGYPDYDTTAQELKDIQRVVNETLPDVEALLKKTGSFKPFAVVILANDSLAEIAVKDTAKTGYTEEDLKEELSIGALKGMYKVVAIFYPSQVTDPATGKVSKAVALFAEHTDDDFAYLFYYPYKISPGKGVIFGDSFGDFAPQVMFKPD